MYVENLLAISPSKYQEIGCSSLSFDYTCKIRWDWAQIASATFYSTKSLSIKKRCSLPIIMQKASHSSIHPQTRWASTGGTYSQHLSNDRIVSKHWEKKKPMGARLQQENALWRYGNVWEGNRVSSPAICSWFWTNSSSRWMCSNI